MASSGESTPEVHLMKLPLASDLSQLPATMSPAASFTAAMYGMVICTLRTGAGTGLAML
jgi:hypothetical protein